MTRRVLCGVVAVCGLAVLTAVSVGAKPPRKEAKVEIGGEFRHRFLGGSYHGKVYIVDKEGKVEWEYPAPNCQDVFLLADGSILFSTRSDAKIVTRDKKILWQYKPKGKTEIHSCAPLKNGNVLMTVSGQSRIIEVDKTGKLVKEITFAAISKKTGNTHMELRDSLKTEKGTYIVAFLNEGLFREIDDTGKVLRTITPAGGKQNTASSIVPLKGGRYLIGTGYGRTVVEMDADNKVVWKLTETDDLKMGYVAAAVRLPNGNTVVSCYKGTYAFFEVTRDKKVVWSIKGGPFHGTTAIQLLD